MTLFMLISMTTAAFAADHLEGRPWVNPELPGNLPDEKPALEDNYYLYVNYEQHQQAAAEDYMVSSAWGQAEKEVADNVWTMINTGDSTEVKALRILTSLFLDTDRREKDGLEPLMAYVRRVRETKTVKELSSLCREEGFLFGSPYATFWIEQSWQEPDKFAISVQPAVFVPNVEVPEETEGEVLLDTKKIENELVLLGWEPDKARQMSERLGKLQNELNSGTMEGIPDEEIGEQKTLTPDDILNACTPLYDQMVSQGMIQEGKIYQTTELAGYQMLQKLYQDENLDMFQAIVCLSMYHYAADFLDQATFAGTRDILQNIDKEAAFYCLRVHFKYLTEQAYADTYISSKQRSEILELTENCKQLLAEKMRSCEWLSEESRQKAAQKAEKMKVLIVTPQERVDWEQLLNALDRDGINLLQAAIQYDQVERNILLHLAGSEFDAGSRYMVSSFSMLDANAVYEPNKNTFFIMAGILRPAFFDDSSVETLLATLGTTIAHEMSHGFETNGIQYDETGRNICVLTEEDNLKLQERAQRLIDNLSSIELADGRMVNGAFNLCEESADLMGVRLTLDMAANKENFDYDLYFRTLARNFFRCFKTREEAMSIYDSDTHPAYYIRANYTLAQYEEFYRTYPVVQEGTDMYYAPEYRRTLW